MIGQIFQGADRSLCCPEYLCWLELAMRHVTGCRIDREGSPRVFFSARFA
jgi:hypothetical protein